MLTAKARTHLQASLRSGNFWTYIIFAFIAAICFYKANRFKYPHFIFSYPFISYDGFQWMSDSLHYMDRHIEITQRNPLLPITFALLKYLHITDFFTFFIAAITISFYVAAYWLVRAFATPSVSRLTVFWFFFVFRIHNFFDYVLADPWCLVLVTAGLGFLARAPKDMRKLLGAAACFGLALNYQFAPVFTAPALLWFVWRGVGVAKLKAHSKIVAISTAVFLALALPQFIYKWIAFGSPLYSHVIHFPLLRVHLFGLPYYAVNIFAFLGWPLALVMFYGVRKTFYERAFNLQLIHLYALCMTIFWILSYLWLDVRFLLYLVPAWLVYSAYGIEKLDLLNWLSFRGKTPIHRAAIIVAIYFAISLPAIQFIAFESNALPITPQMMLRFSSSPISEWGVATLTTDKITTEHSDSYESLFNLSGYFKFYRSFSRNPIAQSGEFIHDVEEVADVLVKESSSIDKIGLCGDLGKVYETKMRIFFSIARNVGDCSAVNKIWLVANKDQPILNVSSGKFQELWRGTEMALFRAKNL